MSNVDKTIFRIEVVQCEEPTANLKIFLPKKLAPGGRTSWSILFGFSVLLAVFSGLGPCPSYQSDYCATHTGPQPDR